jgi:uncharacterized protein (DUF2147 family)
VPQRRSPFIIHCFSRTLFFLLLVFCLPSLQGQQAGDLVGEWYTGDNEGVVKIRAEHGVYTGELISLKIPLDKNNQPKKDRKNKNEKLRSRPLVGIVVLEAMTFDAPKRRWSGGTIYIPKLGKEANCIITMDHLDQVTVRGYYGSPVAGHTQVWTRKRRSS